MSHLQAVPRRRRRLPAKAAATAEDVSGIPPVVTAAPEPFQGYRRWGRGFCCECRKARPLFKGPDGAKTCRDCIVEANEG